jgi:hypothetical protein
MQLYTYALNDFPNVQKDFLRVPKKLIYKIKSLLREQGSSANKRNLVIRYFCVTLQAFP